MINFLNIDSNNNVEDVAQLNDFVLRNYTSIDAIRIDTATLVGAIGMSSNLVSNMTDINLFLTLNKLGRKIFNNSFFKRSGNSQGLSSPVFVSEICSYIDFNNESSFLRLAYYYSIPVFITDISNLNVVFCNDIQTVNYQPIVSESSDYKFLHILESKYDICNYYLDKTYSFAFWANILRQNGDKKIIDLKDNICGEEKELKYLLDDLQDGFQREST